MKTHWLFGHGPDRILDFNVEIDAETSCGGCAHKDVCDKQPSQRCSNYTWGTSEGSAGCAQCLHKYTRYDKDSVPCFHCKDFKAEAAQVRKDTLLRAAYDLLKRSATEHYVQEATSILTHYDGTDCDGYCLMDDIANVLDLADGTAPVPLKECGDTPDPDCGKGRE